MSKKVKEKENGVDSKWEEIIRNNDDFNDERCFKALKKNPKQKGKEK